MTLPRVVALVAGLLCFSSSAFGTGIGIDSTGGTFSTAALGLQLTGGTLTLVTGLGSPYDGNVSGDATSLSFSLGVPNTGSTAGGSATWTTGGGSFDFKDTTTGLVFTGAFTCTVSQACKWSETASSSVFSATFAGLLNGKPVNGVTAEITLGGFNLGITAATIVPEVGTLGMVGMGLLGMAALTKRKWFTRTKKALG